MVFAFFYDGDGVLSTVCVDMLTKHTAMHGGATRSHFSQWMRCVVLYIWTALLEYLLFSFAGAAAVLKHVFLPPLLKIINHCTTVEKDRSFESVWCKILCCCKSCSSSGWDMLNLSCCRLLIFFWSSYFKFSWPSWTNADPQQVRCGGS